MTTSTTHSHLKTTSLAICALLLMSTFGAAPAFAKACKNIHIEVKNNTSDKVKIVDLDYWDAESEKWRSKPVKNEIINKNRIWQKNVNLGRVNGQDVKIRMEYKKVKWSKFFKKWVSKGRKIKAYSVMKKCTKNSEFIMNLR